MRDGGIVFLLIYIYLVLLMFKSEFVDAFAYFVYINVCSLSEKISARKLHSIVRVSRRWFRRSPFTTFILFLKDFINSVSHLFSDSIFFFITLCRRIFVPLGIFLLNYFILYLQKKKKKS